MATKQTETQNFFDMFNNLGDQRQLMKIEIKEYNMFYIKRSYVLMGTNLIMWIINQMFQW